MSSNNGHDGTKQYPTPLSPGGKGWETALRSRAQAILNTLMSYLASNYVATTPSTAYGNQLRAVATELARLTLELEDLMQDVSFEGVRSEFLWQVIAYMLFIDGPMPDLGPDTSDESFKEFLLQIIKLFFQGSTPASVAEAVALFEKGKFQVREIFNSPEGRGDVSRQFEFVVESEGVFTQDHFRVQKNIKTLMNIIKPAHTLYSIRHVFHDIFTPEDQAPKLGDAGFWDMKDYRYEDVRRYCKGLGPLRSGDGYISEGVLDVLWEGGTAPLQRVHRGCTLRIGSGPNEGVYLVLETLTSPSGASGVRVSPRFRHAETGVGYEVEIDRLGARETGPYGEDVSSQFH